MSSLGLGGIFIHLYYLAFVKELWYILAIQVLRRLRLEDLLVQGQPRLYNMNLSATAQSKNSLGLGKVK